MITSIIPKLPMRSKNLTKSFYIRQLGFMDIGATDYPNYLLLKKDEVELQFFEFEKLNPLENYGQVYIRTNDIEALHKLAIEQNLLFSSGGWIEPKPWGQIEFSLLDPDYNLLTFGQEMK